MKLQAIHIFCLLLFALVLTCALTNWCNFGVIEGNASGGASLRSAAKKKKQSDILSEMEKELDYDTKMTSELLNDSKENYSNKNDIIPGVPTPKHKHNRAHHSGHNRPHHSGHNRPHHSGHNNAPIPGSLIPPGQEDMYILKSEIVPPVCPALPNNANCPREKPCQPCPPCARCPEPSFECKKVPNYQAGNTSTYLPKPILTDFSQFGI